MGYYQPPVAFEPHNFNSSTLTLNSPDLDAAHVVEALDTVEVEFKENRWATSAVASGQAIFEHMPSLEGTLKLTLMEASASSGILSQLARSNSPVTFSFTDENSPELNCSSAQARVEKHAVVKRANEVDKPEWVFVCTYLKCESGGYRIQSVV